MEVFRIKMLVRGEIGNKNLIVYLESMKIYELLFISFILIISIF